jgi:hypothetical protein
VRPDVGHQLLRSSSSLVRKTSALRRRSPATGPAACCISTHGCPRGRGGTPAFTRAAAARLPHSRQRACLTARTAEVEREPRGMRWIDAVRPVGG